MKTEIRSFEDLDCWKLCTEIRRDLMQILKKYPSEEKFGLTDNTRRASRSATQNIAEVMEGFITMTRVNSVLQAEALCMN